MSKVKKIFNDWLEKNGINKRKLSLLGRISRQSIHLWENKGALPQIDTRNRLLDKNINILEILAKIDQVRHREEKSLQKENINVNL